MGAGLAGALLTIFMRFASPDTLHWTKSGELMVMVILGGVGSFFGPLWGAAAFLILQTYLASDRALAACDGPCSSACGDGDKRWDCRRG